MTKIAMSPGSCSSSVNSAVSFRSSQSTSSLGIQPPANQQTPEKPKESTWVKNPNGSRGGFWR